MRNCQPTTTNPIIEYAEEIIVTQPYALSQVPAIELERGWVKHVRGIQHAHVVYNAVDRYGNIRTACSEPRCVLNRGSHD